MSCVYVIVCPFIMCYVVLLYVLSSCAVYCLLYLFDDVGAIHVQLIVFVVLSCRVCVC